MTSEISLQALAHAGQSVVCGHLHSVISIDDAERCVARMFEALQVIRLHHRGVPMQNLVVDDETLQVCVAYPKSIACRLKYLSAEGNLLP